MESLIFQPVKGDDYLVVERLAESVETPWLSISFKPRHLLYAGRHEGGTSDGKACAPVVTKEELSGGKARPNSFLLESAGKIGAELLDTPAVTRLYPKPYN